MKRENGEKEKHENGDVREKHPCDD